jgi:hypothetical protein
MKIEVTIRPYLNQVARFYEAFNLGRTLEVSEIVSPGRPFLPVQGCSGTSETLPLDIARRKERPDQPENQAKGGTEPPPVDLPAAESNCHHGYLGSFRGPEKRTFRSVIDDHWRL